MDLSILNDHKVISYFSAEFRHFLVTNSPLATNSSLLWETSKAYARELIISYTAAKRSKSMEQVFIRKKVESIREGLYQNCHSLHIRLVANNKGKGEIGIYEAETI